MSVGLGIHGEPGIAVVDLPTADEIAQLLVDKVLVEKPEDDGGRIAVLLNGLGTVKYEDVLKLAEVDTPAVGDQEVLVRVRASSANPWDWYFIRGEPVLMRPAGIGGIRKPTFLIPGGDLAGTVEQVGGRVTGFAPGDHVNEHIWRDAVDGRRPAGAPAAEVGAPARGSGGP